MGIRVVNDAATAGGTPSGIFILNNLTLFNFVRIIGAVNPQNIAIRRPWVPRKRVGEFPPAAIGLKVKKAAKLIKPPKILFSLYVPARK